MDDAGVQDIAQVDVRRAADRYLTTSAGVQTWHSFSSGAHYDPANTGHGALVACDEHLLAPGAGFAPHPHRGLAIVTWVLDGSLRHSTEDGAPAVIRGGALLRSGSGTTHSEVNASATQPLRFLQAWLLAEEDGPASYDVLDGAGDGGWVEVIGGRRALRAARIAAGASLLVPALPRGYLLVTHGSVRLAETSLDASDAIRLTASPALAVVARTDAEVLLWLLVD